MNWHAKWLLVSTASTRHPMISRYVSIMVPSCSVCWNARNAFTDLVHSLCFPNYSTWSPQDVEKCGADGEDGRQMGWCRERETPSVTTDDTNGGGTRHELVLVRSWGGEQWGGSASSNVHQPQSAGPERRPTETTWPDTAVVFSAFWVQTIADRWFWAEEHSRSKKSVRFSGLWSAESS